MCGISRGLVFSENYLVLRVLGLKVKESRLDRSSRLIVLGVSVGRADIKPLARELGRSQELVMEAGAESLRVSWDETQQISPLILQTRRVGPQMRSGRARAHLEDQTSPLTPPPLGSPSLPSTECSLLRDLAMRCLSLEAKKCLQRLVRISPQDPG